MSHPQKRNILANNIKYPFQTKKTLIKKPPIFVALFPMALGASQACHDPTAQVMLMLRRLSSDLSEGGGSPRHRPEKGKRCWPEPVGGGIIDSALAPLSGISGVLVGAKKWRNIWMKGKVRW